MSAGQSPVLPPSSGCCSPRPPEPGLARVPQGLPFMTNPCSRAPRSPFTAHPLFPSFPAIPISQIFPASAEVFCRVCQHAGVLGCSLTGAWLGREGRAQGGGFSMGDTAWPGPNPSAALPTPQGCPGPTAAPRGSPKLGTPQKCPAAPCTPCPWQRLEGEPRASGEAAPDPLNFLCRNQGRGAAPCQALHAQAGRAPLNRPLKCTPKARPSCS